MVRFTVLTCVFGIASFCLVSVINASSSYAQPPQCPCWTDGIDIHIDSSNIYQCDDVPQINGAESINNHPDTQIAAAVTSDDTNHTPMASAYMEARSGGITMECTSTCPAGVSGCTPTNTPETISQAEIHACLQDILAYCRDYCMNNPNEPACE